MTPTRPVAITPMKARVAGGLRKLSSQMADAFPEMNVHQHLTDAAREVDAGRTHSAQRHIHAAIFHMTPLQMHRHGVHDDAGHMRGKAFMQQAHRHLLLVKDIEDVGTSNDGIRQRRADDRDRETQERAMRVAARTNPLPTPKANSETPEARMSEGDPSGPRVAGTPSGAKPVAAVPAKPIAASWERHLQVIELVAVHESAAGRAALQKKGQTAYGKSYPVPNVRYLHKALKAVGRVAPGKRGVLRRFLQKRAKQLGVSHHLKGTWADPNVKQMASEIVLANYGIVDEFIDLVGPKGWSHGWIRALGVGSAAASIEGGAGNVGPLEPRRVKPGRTEALRTGTGMPTGGDKARRTLIAVQGGTAKPPSRLARVGRAVEHGLESGLGMGSAVEQMGSRGKLGGRYEPLGSGRKNAKGFADMMASTNLGSWKDARAGLEPRQQAVYDKLRAQGKSHNKALRVAQAAGSFLAGSVQPTSLANPGPRPFPVGLAS